MSAVVQIRPCYYSYVYTKQIEDVHDIKLFIYA